MNYINSYLILSVKSCNHVHPLSLSVQKCLQLEAQSCLGSPVLYQLIEVTIYSAFLYIYHLREYMISVDDYLFNECIKEIIYSAAA